MIFFSENKLWNFMHIVSKGDYKICIKCQRLFSKKINQLSLIHVRLVSRSGNIFPGDWSWNIFTDSRRAVVSFCRKNVQVLVKGSEVKACPGKVWLGKLSAFNMTIMGWLGRNISTRSNLKKIRKNISKYCLHDFLSSMQRVEAISLISTG